MLIFVDISREIPHTYIEDHSTRDTDSEKQSQFLRLSMRLSPSSGRSALIATTPPFSDNLDWTHANSTQLDSGGTQSSRKASKRARGASYASKASKASTHFELTYRAPRSLPFCDDETRFWRLPRCP